MLFDLLYFPGAALSTGKIEFYSESEEKIFRNINFYLSLLKGHEECIIGRETCTHGFFFERMFGEYELKLKIQRPALGYSSANCKVTRRS